eukprot:1980770-Rhodomonas_salina.2
MSFGVLPRGHVSGGGSEPRSRACSCSHHIEKPRAGRGGAVSLEEVDEREARGRGAFDRRTQCSTRRYIPRTVASFGCIITPLGASGLLYPLHMYHTGATRVSRCSALKWRNASPGEVFGEKILELSTGFGAAKHHDDGYLFRRLKIGDVVLVSTGFGSPLHHKVPSDPSCFVSDATSAYGARAQSTDDVYGARRRSTDVGYGATRCRRSRVSYQTRGALSSTWPCRPGMLLAPESVGP